MSHTKIDEPHNTYKRLNEEQPDPTAMAYSGTTTAFTNPMPEAYPNPYNLAYPNPNAAAHGDQNTTPHPNATNLLQYPDSVGTSQPNSKYAMAFSQGEKFSAAPDSDTSINNEAPKPTDTFTADIEVPGFDFSEKIIRKMFIRKVYAVLMCQLLLTVAITAFFMYCEPVRLFLLQRENVMPIYLTMGVLGLVLLLMMFCTELRRVAPWNLVFLAMFTVTQGVIVGILGAYVDSTEILLAFGITAGVVLALTLFAFQTKWDFTTLGAGLLATLLVLMVFSLVAGCVPQYRSLRLLYSGAGVILFSLYIIYDTQLMVGGGHKYAISPEEYVFAALTLYLDILNLFIYILRMMRS